MDAGERVIEVREDTRQVDVVLVPSQRVLKLVRHLAYTIEAEF